MTSSMGVRWGGLAGEAAGVMFLLSGILTLIAPPQGAPSSLGEYVLRVVLIVAFVLALVAVAGLHAAQSRSGHYGRLGTTGALLTFVGYAIVLVAAHITTLAGGESTTAVRLGGGLVVLIGSILLGAVLEEAVAVGTENIVFAIVWGSIGYALLTRRGAAAEQPTRVS